MNGYSPWDELDRLRRQMEKALNGPTRTPAWRLAFLPGTGARQYPRVNLSEDSDRLRVEALAPGVDPATFEVTVKEDTLTIAGEKKAAAGVQAEEYHRSERAVGKFLRTVQLPTAVDPEQVKASYSNGILEVTLEKSAAARPRQIPVQLG